MATYNHIIKVTNGNNTDVYHPETNSSQVYDFANSAWLGSLIGVLNTLSTVKKSTIVEALNEINSTKASNTALTSHATSIAKTSQIGHVKPDGKTIIIDENGVISSVGGGVAEEHTHTIDQIVGLESTVAGALSLKAPLASPNFTGTPTVPTAIVDSNSTEIANTAFVQSVLKLTLDNYKAYFDSLMDHTHTMDQILGLEDTFLSLLNAKAALDSPALIGTPTAPTPTISTNTNQIATTAFVQTAINNKNSITGNAASATKLETARTINGVSFDGTANITISDSTKAPLASPTFTGTPSAPTASAATNTTQIATTAYVTTAITNKTTITGNAGSATKLATARTINGVSFDGTANITIADSTKAPLASPALTGTPTAPTPANTTNTTQIATTAFVQSNFNSHLNDFMPHESSLSQTASNMDAKGIYTVVEFKRADNTLYMRSTASNPNANGNYQTLTWQFYATNGTTLSLTKTWTITYNENGMPISKVVV